MRRGTTPTITLILKGINVTDLNTIKVTLKQNNIELTKSTDDVNVDEVNNAIFFNLTQSETLQFSKGRVDVQIRGILSDGVTAIASKIKVINMEQILLDGVIEADHEVVPSM